MLIKAKTFFHFNTTLLFAMLALSANAATRHWTGASGTNWTTAGNTFTILANDGTDAVQGTFMDLPQNAVFLLDGAAFSISYTGGTGNDIVLTRVVGPSTLGGATRLISGQVQFQGMGEPSLTYIIQAHTNLNTTNWLTIGIAPADGTGFFQFFDPNAPLFPRRFYRAISP